MKGTFFSLLRIALGTSDEEVDMSAFTKSDWDAVVNLALEHGVAAIVLDGLQKIYDRFGGNVLGNLYAPENASVRYRWFGTAMAMETAYEANRRVMEKLVDFFASNGIRSMVLKGYSLSLNYPVPSHRPAGDIDIYHYGKWREADNLMYDKFGIRVEKSHEHHTVYVFKGQTVENHYDFINTRNTSSSRWIEAKLKELADAGRIADFNAIFLMRHMGQHFAGERITIRHLLDWGLFIDKHSNEIVWDEIIPFWNKMGIAGFAQCINAICVSELGISADKFQGQLSGNHALAHRILADILKPEFNEDKPGGGTAKVIAFKLRRFFANGWKRKLVYRESLAASFVSGGFAHLEHFDSITD